MSSNEPVVIIFCTKATLKNHIVKISFGFTWCETEEEVFELVGVKHPTKEFHIHIADGTVQIDLNKLIQKQNVARILICYEFQYGQCFTDVRIERVTIKSCFARLEYAQYEILRNQTIAYAKLQDTRQILLEEKTEFHRQNLMTVTTRGKALPN